MAHGGLRIHCLGQANPRAQQGRQLLERENHVLRLQARLPLQEPAPLRRLSRHPDGEHRQATLLQHADRLALAGGGDLAIQSRAFGIQGPVAEAGHVRSR